MKGNKIWRSVNSAVSQLETVAGSCEHVTNSGFHTRGRICSRSSVTHEVSWRGTILQRATLQFRVLHAAWRSCTDDTNWVTNLINILGTKCHTVQTRTVNFETNTARKYERHRDKLFILSFR